MHVRRIAAGSALAIALGCSGSTPTKTTRPSLALAPEPEPEPEDERRRILRLYDEAGFPDVSGYPIVRRRVGVFLDRPACVTGVLIPHGTDQVLLSTRLRVHYDGVLVDRIPPYMRRDEPYGPYREGWLRTARSHVIPRPVPLPDVFEVHLPPPALLHPGLASPLDEDCVNLDGSFGDDELLDSLTRARWAEMKGLPVEVELLSGNAEANYRAALCRRLRERAERGLRQWLPRTEIAKLYQRAARICPNSEPMLDWEAQLQPVEPSGDPDSAEYLVRILEQRRIHFDEFERMRASWDVEALIRDPARELHMMGDAAVPALLSRMGDPTRSRDGPTVGSQVRWVAGMIAGRQFRTDGELLRWWSVCSPDARARDRGRACRRWRRASPSPPR